MPIIDDVKSILASLENGGWADLFAHHGLNIGAANLKNALLQPLSNIDRSIPGFEDFAPNASRGIERGKPSHSLLYPFGQEIRPSLRPRGTARIRVDTAVLHELLRLNKGTCDRQPIQE